MRPQEKWLRAVSVAALMAVAPVGFAAEPLPIESGPHDPLIHPIAPEDGAEAVTNPPSMVFWWSPEAASYTVEMAQDADLADAIVAAKIELPFYNHSEVLQPGTWYWRYCFETEDGRRSEYSAVRRFVVTESSIPLPVPPVDQVLRRMQAIRASTPPGRGWRRFARAGTGRQEALMRR